MIPSSWNNAHISDIATEVRATVKPLAGQTYELWSVPAYATGRPEILDGSAIGSAKLRVQSGDVLVCKINPRINRVWVVTENLSGLPQIASPEWLVLRFPVEVREVTPRFMAAYLSGPTFRRWITGAVSGVTGSHTRAKSKDILRQTVPVPPVTEQRRIVEVLEEGLARIDSGVNGISVARERLSIWNEALLTKAVNGELASPSSEDASQLLSLIRTRGEDLAPKSRKISAPVKFHEYSCPAGWEMASLSEISYSWGYGTSTKCTYEAAGVPVLRIPNVVNGRVNAVTDVKCALDPNLDLSELYLRPGDLLFVRTNGSPELIGRVGVVVEPLDVAFASYLIRFRLIPDGVYPEWVRIVVNSPIWRRHIVKAAASSAGQYNINSKILSSLPIPVPPREEQLEIIMQLQQWQDHSLILEETISLAEERARMLRESVLAHAFSGRLVPPDADVAASPGRRQTNPGSSTYKQPGYSVEGSAVQESLSCE